MALEEQILDLHPAIARIFLPDDGQGRNGARAIVGPNEILRFRPGALHGANLLQLGDERLRLIPVGTVLRDLKSRVHSSLPVAPFLEDDRIGIHIGAPLQPIDFCQRRLDLLVVRRQAVQLLQYLPHPDQVPGSHVLVHVIPQCADFRRHHLVVPDIFQVVLIQCNQPSRDDQAGSDGQHDQHQSAENRRPLAVIHRDIVPAPKSGLQLDPHEQILEELFVWIVFAEARERGDRALLVASDDLLHGLFVKGMLFERNCLIG